MQRSIRQQETVSANDDVNSALNASHYRVIGRRRERTRGNCRDQRGEVKRRLGDVGQTHEHILPLDRQR